MSAMVYKREEHFDVVKSSKKSVNSDQFRKTVFGYPDMAIMRSVGIVIIARFRYGSWAEQRSLRTQYNTSREKSRRKSGRKNPGEKSRAPENHRGHRLRKSNLRFRTAPVSAEKIYRRLVLVQKNESSNLLQVQIRARRRACKIQKEALSKE